MKTNYLKVLSMLVLVILFAACQNAGQKEEKIVSMEEFNQVMEEYHSIMAASFHPAMGGDLEPSKERHERLLEEAEKFAAFGIPQEMEVEKIQGLLDELVVKSEEFSKAITDALPDEKIEELLYALHDVFHKINEECSDDEEVEEGADVDSTKVEATEEETEVEEEIQE